ncbi:hypothetical protein BAUCODRAFT_34803 [Baudoinia panamericana UAMH 10762]|uniref:Uncharacterized protein n=1 Tax=Baudoinia panamericana (strain UAMH 10762) TaxID=717646 RepID=M2MWY0_BAUPA|nr:uncharacterized protein BAUCODRAFT_34803 [Baudoinia panamericana UAMH 10762]EMC96038.1 hypothetical protein BAUCODRAFT_34803 [Baudoinia panamericana UAMH 10762]
MTPPSTSKNTVRVLMSKPLAASVEYLKRSEGRASKRRMDGCLSGIDRIPYIDDQRWYSC